MPKCTRVCHASAGMLAHSADPYPYGGHEACDGCTDMGAAVSCRRWRLGRRWGSPWGHDPRQGCATMGA
eukprot:679879-Pyramimonas_sp.AAC.1